MRVGIGGLIAQLPYSLGATTMRRFLHPLPEVPIVKVAHLC